MNLPPHKPPPAPPAGKKKILIVDDEEGIRESLRLILAGTYDLILTENGAEALIMLKGAAKAISLVLLDLRMPLVDGVDTLKKIKTLYPRLAVIIITGDRSAENAQETLRIGASDFILKPFKPHEILAAVERSMPLGNDA